MSLNDLALKMTEEEFDMWVKQKYAIKVELIKDLDMELGEFVSWNKVNKEDKRIGKLGNVKRKEAISWWDSNKLTRYNGLTKVIMIGDEKE